MTPQTVLDISTYEQALAQIVHTLPAERVVQILDYTRCAESQAREATTLLEEDATEEAILADEAEWDAKFATTQAGLQKMADKVRAKICVGHTTHTVYPSRKILSVMIVSQSRG